MRIARCEEVTDHVTRDHRRVRGELARQDARVHAAQRAPGAVGAERAEGTLLRVPVRSLGSVYIVNTFLRAIGRVLRQFVDGIEGDGVIAAEALEGGDAAQRAPGAETGRRYCTPA